MVNDQEDGQVQEVAMDILEDERKTLLPLIVPGILPHCAGGRVLEEGPVIGFAEVIASRTKSRRCPQDENGGGPLEPGWGKKGREGRGNIGTPLVVNLPVRAIGGEGGPCHIYDEG
jgi:hypothetical protein